MTKKKLTINIGNLGPSGSTKSSTQTELATQSSFDKLVAEQVRDPAGKPRKPEELHPTVIALLRNSYFVNPEMNKAQHDKFMQIYKTIVGCPEVPPQLFQEYCVAIATGMQFVADALPQESRIDLIKYTVQPVLPDNAPMNCGFHTYNDKDGKPCIERIIGISTSHMVNARRVEMGGRSKFITKHSQGEALALKETYLVTGAEEMDHAIRQYQAWIESGKKVPFILDEKGVDIIEAKATPLVVAAMEAYNIGASRRGREPV